MTRLAYIPNRIIDHNGIADGATVHVYLSGTTTPVLLYSNSTMTVSTANPFTVAAGAAFPAVYYDSSVDIKLTIVSALDGSIEEYDPYNPPSPSLSSSIISVKSFGAVGDGVADDTTAIAAAITVAGSGGTVLLEAKNYLISSTLVLSQNGAKLIGPGAGDLHDIVPQIVAPCRLKWGGALGGTMVKVKSTTSQYISNNEVHGIFFDGNNGLAAVGLNTVGCRLGTFETVGAHFTTALYKSDPDPTLGEAAGNSENRILRVSGYQTNVGDGALVLETGTALWNCSQNVYELISGGYINGPVVIIGGSDSQTFQCIKLYSSDASPGIILKAGPNVNQAARNNMFHYLAVTNATIPVVAEGTGDNTVASYENNILFLDTAANPNLPAIHTGASLWWGTIKAPIGMRSYAPNSAGNSVRQEASGLIIQSGTSGSIAGGGSATITLPKAFLIGAISVQVTPKNAGMACYADCSSTQIVINNTGGSPATFNWRVEGY